MIKTKQDFINEIAERLNNRNIHVVAQTDAILIDDTLTVEQLLTMEKVIGDVHALVPMSLSK